MNCRESTKSCSHGQFGKRLEFNCQPSHFDFNLKRFLRGALFLLGVMFVLSCVLAKTLCKTPDSIKDL